MLFFNSLKKQMKIYLTLFQISILLIIPLLIISCSFQQKEDLPKFNVEMKDLNHDVYLYAERSINSFKPSKILTLDLHVFSEEIVRFPVDFGLQVFYYSNSSWTDITPNIEIIHMSTTNVPNNPNTIIVSPDQPNKDPWFYYFKPEQPGIEKIKPVRIHPLISKIGSGKSKILIYVEGERIESKSN